MPTILALSSTVVVGHVGLAAITPAATLAGATVWGLPTIALSNHPGFPTTAGTRIDAETLREMIDAIEAGGWLSDVTTLLTGYLPSTDHVAIAEDLTARLRKANPAVLVICDPVLGDDPKGVYIDLKAAATIRDRLIPTADCLLPNRFELAWLTGQDVTDPDSAQRAAAGLHLPRVIAKSIPDGDGHIANIEITPERTAPTRHSLLRDIPKGTGDVFSGLIAAGWSLPRTAQALETLAGLSQGRDHLAIVETADQWTRHRPHQTGNTRMPAEARDHGAPEIAGVDGCPGGWIAVSHPLDRPDLAQFEIFPTFDELLARTPRFAAIAVDMPIGLPDIAERGGRQADREARTRLGARQSSVFAIPARAAIACTDYREACDAAFRHSDPPRKIAKQTFNLFPKIRELDQLLTPEDQAWVVECHPEVVFWAMNDETPLDQPKKVKSRPYGPGLELRRRLLASQGFDPAFLDGPYPSTPLASIDDFLDACAAAWTAARLVTGTAQRLPAEPPVDARGLRMEIVY